MNRKRLGLCIATGLAATAAGADNIDLGTELAKRLRAANQLDAIYRTASGGRPMPPNLPVAVFFEGSVAGRGLNIVAPMPVSSPKVLQQSEIVNCGDSPVDQTLEINSTTANTASFENQDQVSTEHLQEVSIEVSYKIGDLGSKASYKDAWKKTNLTMRKDGGSTTETVTWKNSPRLTVPPKKVAVAQFVISEEQLSRVPYTANYVVAGNARVVFNAGAEGFRWVQRAGASLPTSPNPPLLFRDARAGANLYACRYLKDDKYVIGVSGGPASACFTASFANRVPIGNQYIADRSESYEWLVGNQAALDAALGGAGASGAFDAGKGARVCFGNFGGNTVPGQFQADGSCGSAAFGPAPFYGFTIATRDFRTLLDPAAGGVEARVDLGKYLGEAQRTFDIHGYFSGVASVNGHVRVKSRPAKCGGAGPAAVQASMPSQRSAQAALPVTHVAPEAPIKDAEAQIPVPGPGV
jgi:hypothetical protein